MIEIVDSRIGYKWQNYTVPFMTLEASSEHEKEIKEQIHAWYMGWC